MKKTIFLVAALTLMTANNFAQLASEETAPKPIELKSSSHSSFIGLSSDRDSGDILLTDDFSDASNWTFYTESGTTYDWEILTTPDADMTAYIAEMESPTNDNGYGAFNGIQYLLTSTVLPIDALIEYVPTIDCSALPFVTLEFFMAYRAFNLDDIFVEVSNDDWGTFESYPIFIDAVSNGPTIQEFVRVNITSTAAGEADVKVRFRFQELTGDSSFGSGYGCMLDDLTIFQTYDYDQALTASFHRSGAGVYSEIGLDYYQIPERQMTEIDFFCYTENIGALTQINAKLNVGVTGAGTFSSTSPPIDLLSEEVDTFTTSTSFTPSAIGEYDITYWVDSDNTEEITDNDTLYSVPITVTDEADGFIYARDNGIAQGSINNVSSNTGLPFLIGNVMTIFADDTISAVEISITDDAENVGQIIFGQLMIYDEDAGTFIYTDQTDDHEITEEENGGSILIDFELNNPLEAGQVILLLAGHYGGTDEVGFKTAQIVDEQSVLGYTAGATDPFFLLTPQVIMIRAKMEAIDVTDTDGDGIYDSAEFDSDGDGEGPDDTDGDGIFDYLDTDDDGDGIPTEDETAYGDTDGDGIDDYLDVDDDGDGILTEDEIADGDTDENGIPNYRDNDDDGNGVPTADEWDSDEDGEGPDDTDGDGVDDYLDTDDDGDGVLTEVELGEGDTDGDGIDDYLDVDDDGDTVLTEDELEEGDTDGDGIDDYLDTDDDGDGVLTIDEWDFDGDGEGPDDTDGDGIADYLDHNGVGIDEEKLYNFTIDQNIPNPFDGETTINYSLKESASVTLIFRDVSGKLVKTISNENQQVGKYAFIINANDFAAGVYYYTFIVDENQITKKMVISKK